MEEDFSLFAENYRYIGEKSSHLQSLSDSLYSDIAGEYRRTHPIPPSHEEVAGLYEQIHGVTAGVKVSADYARFCRAFSLEYPGGLTSFTEKEKSNTPYTFAYLQNTFSDRAYMQFARRFEETSPAHFPEFREVCEEVANGNCSFGILPIYNSRDGQLISFRKLILQYELKIVLVSDVTTSEDGFMRFALLQKSTDNRFPPAGDYLELVVVPEAGEYGAFLSACEELGASVLTLQSIPIHSFVDRFALSVQLDIRQACRDALFFFIESARIRCDAVGVYDILRT